MMMSKKRVITPADCPSYEYHLSLVHLSVRGRGRGPSGPTWVSPWYLFTLRPIQVARGLLNGGFSSKSDNGVFTLQMVLSSLPATHNLKFYSS